MANYVNKITHEQDAEIRGRNPTLQGQTLDVYYFIKQNPDCTRADVTQGCSLRSSSATARVKELIDMGLVHSSPARTKISSKTGKRVQVLRAMEEGLHKKPRDSVNVIVTLQVDAAGNYHAKARVLGELLRQGKVVDVMTKDVTVIAPYASDIKHHFMKPGKNNIVEVPLSDTLANVSLIIDGT